MPRDDRDRQRSRRGRTGPDGIKTTDRIKPGRFNRRLNYRRDPGLMVQAWPGATGRDLGAKPGWREGDATWCAVTSRAIANGHRQGHHQPCQSSPSREAAVISSAASAKSLRKVTAARLAW